MSIGEKLVELNFNVVVALQTTSELRGGSNEYRPKNK
jgi:hypothetical protein